MELKDSQGNWIRDDYLIRQFKTSPTKDIKFFLDWGLQENWVIGANRRLVKVLEEKSYTYNFVEFNGWHDWANSRKSFIKGLKFLLEND